MRIGNTLTLALVLFGSVPVWSQPAKDVVPVPITGTVTGQPADPLVQQSVLDDTITYAENGAPSSRVSPQLFWLRADYLVWYINKEPITPIIQTLPDALASAPTIPAGSGRTVFPDRGELNYNALSGVRLNTGFWFGPESTLGLDVSGFVLETGGQGVSLFSRGSPVLTRFFDNINNGQQTYLLFSSPDPAFAYAGSLSSSVGISSLYSVDGSIRWRGYRVFSDNTDWLFGARHLGFNEKLDVNGNVFLPDGRVLNVQDHFKVRNNFYGGQIGFHSRWAGFYRLSFDSIVKFAVGGTSQNVSINGSNTLTSPDGTRSTQPIGLLATAANSGEFAKGKFTVLPELTFNLNFNVTERAAIYFGYNALYVSNVVRLNSTIDSRVNDSTVRYINTGNAASTRPNPGFSFNDTGMWIQGWNFGARFEY